MARSIYSGEKYDIVYNYDNYMVKYEEKNKASNLCVIYCASSGIYFPNTEEAFVEAFLKQDNKFEWTNHIIKRAYKHIWIRDITKEFYVRGINNRINNIDKLIDFMRKESEGLKLITVGSSGGGYIATVLGSVLKAECVYSFSGFYDLDILDETIWPLIKTREAREDNQKWYQLREEVSKSKVPVLYFWPAKLKGDRKQARSIKGVENVHSYKLNSKVHGIPFGDQQHIDKILNSGSRQLIEAFRTMEKGTIYKFKWDKIMMSLKEI